MDRKLIAAFTFGILAVSVANLLLSVGIVSLLLSEDQETSTQLIDTGNIPGAWTMSGNALSLDDTNNTTMDTSTNTSVADILEANATITPTPSAGQIPATGLPANGQFSQDRGQAPPAGGMPSGEMPSGDMPYGDMPAGGMSSSGQMPATGQYSTVSDQTPQASTTPSNTGQTSSLIEQYLQGTGSNTDSGLSSNTEMIPVDINELFGSLPGTTMTATATPKPSSSFFNNFTSTLTDQ